MKNSNGKVFAFMRKNAVYLVLAFCILAIGLSITLMLLNENGAGNSVDAGNEAPPVSTPVEPEEPNDPVVNPGDSSGTEPVVKPIEFVMPVANATSVNEYTDTMVWCSTLGRFQTHLAVDFFAAEGSKVYAVYDGTVTDVSTTLLEGTTVTVDHGNGLYSVYNSLADGDCVSVGQTVKQGDVIGEVSVTNRQEYKDGAHLHFEVVENGKIIDPAKYLAFDEK